MSETYEDDQRAWREDIKKSVLVDPPEDFHSGFDDWVEIDGDEGARWDKWENVAPGGYIVDPPIDGAAPEEMKKN